MTQILRGRFDTHRQGSRTANPPAAEFSAERYQFDQSGRRVLLGLTSANPGVRNAGCTRAFG
jgi:hypothetical protein